MKLWAGRMSGDVDETVNALNASIGFDSRMVNEDITGSMAHADMLHKIGVLTDDEWKHIEDGLKGILADLESGALKVDMEAEDVHTFIEGELTARIGTDGKRLHTARSRNDQVALDVRMYCVKEIGELYGLTEALLRTLCDLAEKHTESIMPGYTHMQRAQPVTLAHHFMAYAEMFYRDLERLVDCKKRTLVLPLGSGALAATTYPLDRQMVADELGFTSVGMNSMDGVSDRDFVIELVSDLSVLMMHLSRMAEEMCIWSSWEFAFLSFSDSFSTGSSIMPQKKNPDLAELVRGKTARVYGSLITLLTMMKALPLAYDKDMQEDKEALFDAVDTTCMCLKVMPPMLSTATFRTENMANAAKRGFINATDCADYLVGKGVPFREAYRITGELVRTCISLDKTLDTLPLDEYKKASPLFDEGIYTAIDLLTCLKARSAVGGPAPETVKKAISEMRVRVSSLKKA